MCRWLAKLGTILGTQNHPPNQIEGQLSVHPPNKVAKSGSGFEGLFLLWGLWKVVVTEKIVVGGRLLWGQSVGRGLLVCCEGRGIWEYIFMRNWLNSS